jgi:hypothetical protein
MNIHPKDIDGLALRPGINRGDSVLLLNQARNGAAFDSLPGRYGVIAALASAESPGAIGALQILENNRRFVDSGKAAFFAAVPERRSAPELAERFPSIRFLEDGQDWAPAFGAGPDGCWAIVDPMLRVIDIAALSQLDRAFSLLERLPAPTVAFGFSSPAPILFLPGVFEPDLCRHLVDVFDRDGGKETGFMEDAEGKSIERLDHDWKRRRDMMLSDPFLVAGVRARIGRRVCPEIKKAFQFVVSRTERDLIARYDAEAGGHFRPHRDDAGASVAHRRFAMSIPLNDAFDGGEMCFPEYSPLRYKGAPGTAIVFSSSILHGVSTVTRGSRYVFLTFLFDEEAEKVRLANLKLSSAPTAAPAVEVSARWGT